MPSSPISRRNPRRPGQRNYAPKLFGEPATGTPPPLPTRMTASPRSLVPSGRKRNSPSIPAKPEGLGQHLRREPLRALRSRQRRDQRDRVVGQRRGADRLAAVARAIAAREGAEAGRIGRRIETALQVRAYRTRADCPTARCRATGCCANSRPPRSAHRRSRRRSRRHRRSGAHRPVRAPAPRCAPARRGRRHISRTRRCVRRAGSPPFLNAASTTLP